MMAAPMKPAKENNPCSGEKRKVDEGSTPNRRISRRKLGKEPLDVMDSLTPCNQEVRRLITKGGSGGKVRNLIDSEEWNYFPQTHKVPFEILDNEEQNKDVFSSLKDIVDNTIYEESNSETSSPVKPMYQLVDIIALEVAINKFFVTKSAMRTYLNEFSAACAEENKFSRLNKSVELRNKWQRDYENKNQKHI